MTHQHAPRRLSISGLSLALTLGLLGTAQAAMLTRTSAFDYDAATGLLTKEIIEPNISQFCLATVYTYDAYGNKTAVTTRNCNGSVGSVSGINNEAPFSGGDPFFVSRTNGNIYDNRGQFPTRSTNALNHSEDRTYNANFGTLASLTGPNGLATSWNYDGFGRKTRETRADGTQTKWEYLYCSGINGGTAACPTIGGAAGAYVVVVTPLAIDGSTKIGAVTKTYYDALNREIRGETEGYDGSGTSTAIYKDTEYDNLGRPYRTSRPYYSGQTVYWTTVAYDGIGRVISETQPPDGTSTSTTTTTAYNGLTVTVTNANSQTRTTVKNSQGQVVSVTDAQAKTITYAYDAFGNLATTTDPLGNINTLNYDLRGRKTNMADRDMGNWIYFYDALGQLIRQVDAKGMVSIMAYDQLGRLRQRAEADLVSFWYYDTYKGGGACNKGFGKLCQVETDHGYIRQITYDNLGRFSNQTASFGGASYTDSAGYDGNGRLVSRGYPTGFSLQYGYTATLGYLNEIRNSATNALYWQANTLDAAGHLVQQTYGNGVITQQNYNPANGRLTGIVAGAGNGVQNFTYTYDNLGNILSRSDANQALAESFTYDSLNRLETATVNSSGAGIVTTTYGYDAIGNLTHRSDLNPAANSYLYPAAGAAKPHAVSRVNFGAASPWPNHYRTYSYDANGNLISSGHYNASNQVVPGNSRTAFFTSFNMLSVVYNDASSVRLNLNQYGPEHQRLTSTLVDASGTHSTVYVNPDNAGGLFYEKETKPDSSIEHRHYVTAYGVVVAMVRQNGSSTVTRYFHRDNLNSTTAISDENGIVLERLAYEPFGNRRFPSGLTDPNNTIVADQTHRGFTNHEQFDGLDIIHMNGRIYDPVIGRFLSADPYIQAPGNLQSYNRYSYTLNNPLFYTDPTGYKSKWVKFRDNFTKNDAVRTVVIAVAAYYTGGWAYNAYMGAAINAAGGAMAITGAQFASASFTASVIGGASAGFVGGFLASGGDFSAGAYGAIGGAIGGSVSGYFGSNYPAERVLANSFAGGVQSKLQGGSFGDGFRSGAAWSSLAYLNVRMNEYQQALSLKNPSGANDGTGWSRGLFGNGFKAGGGRYDSENPFACSLLGCQQNGPGKVLGISYPSGGFVDMVVESFSGPHDTANMPWFYNMNTGDILRPMSRYREFFGEYLGNYSSSLVFAAPFAAAAIREQTYYPAY